MLFVGRLSAEKGIPLLLDAYSELRAMTPAAMLVLAGPATRRLNLPRLLTRAGLDERTVVITGALSPAEVHSAYQAATVFAFPSLTDTQGIVLHEAALAGLPIVMVDRHLHAGHPLADTIRLAAPVPEDLARALRSSLKAGPRPLPGREAAPGSAAGDSTRLARDLTPERFVDRMLEVYRYAMGGCGGEEPGAWRVSGPG